LRGDLRTTKDANPQHPHDHFTTSSLLRPILDSMQNKSQRRAAMRGPNEMVNVRYMVDDVEDAIAFYTRFLDFEVLTSSGPAFANVTRGNLRLLLSGPTSSAGRPMPDGVKPGPGGWNRIHLIVDDIDTEVARLHEGGAPFRNNIIEGPGGKQVLLQDPSGNVVELFQPAV
jgi:catechol 2,3-dioxygenase-like lactoylglutathione lyase family enzyme